MTVPNETTPDAVILDWMLRACPVSKSGRQLRRKTETRHVAHHYADGAQRRRPTSARPHVGADDYLSKPFSMPELVARVRRFAAHQASQTKGPLTFGDIMLDLDAHRVSRGGKYIPPGAHRVPAAPVLDGAPGYGLLA